eukprot:scaffold277203_cov37-Tisochrysis_lutea.AAC.1
MCMQPVHSAAHGAWRRMVCQHHGWFESSRALSSLCRSEYMVRISSFERARFRASLIKSGACSLA